MTLLDPRERSERGLALQSEVAGKPAADPQTPLQESWRDFVYSEVWSRPGLGRRERFLVSIAASAVSSGLSNSLDLFVYGALATSQLTQAELREAALHLAVYCGWERAEKVDAAITRAEAELGLAPVGYASIRAAPWDPQVRMEQGFAEFNNVMTYDGPPVGNGLPYLQDGILNFVFGEMWCRPGLDQRSRRFLTLVGVADSGADIPIRSHFHAAMASGNCTAAELHEFVLHYAVHAGWPRGSVIQAVVLEMAAKFEQGLPWNA